LVSGLQLRDTVDYLQDILGVWLRRVVAGDCDGDGEYVCKDGDG
jgi:hypothetical protein